MYIALFFIVLVVFAGVTLGYSLIKKKKDVKVGTSDSFLTARESAGGLKMGLSLIAIVMGSWALFSPAEAAYTGGIVSALGYGLAQGGGIIFFAVFGVRLRKLMPRGASINEFVNARYGNAAYVTALIVGLFYMGVLLTSELTGVSSALLSIWGVPIAVSTLGILIGVFLYVVVGGMVSSLFGDTIQGVFIFPTLILAFLGTLVSVGGWGEVAAKVQDPAMLNFGDPAGWRFAITLMVAIFAASQFAQPFWQRSYACKDDSVVRKSFAIGGVIIIPLVIVSALFGVIGHAMDVVTNPSIALFEVVNAVAPGWVIAIIMVLAVTLIMSTVAAYVIGISSVIALDAKRYKRNENMTDAQMLRNARIITAAISVIAALFAFGQFSVLYMFLLADLICAAAVFPTLYGLYNRRMSGKVFVIATISGLVAGGIMFPPPDFSRGDLLYSFLLGLIVPAIICVICGRKGQEVNLEELDSKIQELK